MFIAFVFLLIGGSLAFWVNATPGTQLFPSIVSIVCSVLGMVIVWLILWHDKRT